MREETTVKKKKKKKIWIAVVLIILLAAAFLIRGLRNMGQQMEFISNTVEVEPVQCRDLSDSISIKGTVSGASKTNVMSIASAEVTSVSVQPGDTVSAGDLLVTLDTTDIEKSIASLNTDISNADAIAQNEASQRSEALQQAVDDQSTALSRAQDAINNAQNEYNSLQNKYNSSKDSLENKKNTLAETKSTAESCQKELEAANITVESARTAYSALPEDESLKEAYEAALAQQTARQNAYDSAAASIATLQSEIAALESEVASYEESLKTASRTIDSAKESYNDTVTSTGRTVSSAQNSIDIAKYQSSDSSLSDRLETLNKQLADCTLTAPCSGVVTAVNVSVGDNYAAGTTMITIEDTSSLKVSVNVEESDILKLQEGMRAVITTDATGDNEINGTITRVVRVKNQSVTDSTGSYSAEITIDDSELLIGMTAKARIILSEKAAVLSVPYDLIRYDEAGAAYVLVAEANEDGTATAIRKNVTPGEEVDYYTEITGGELKEGDMLIYDYSGSVSENQIFSPEELYSEQALAFPASGSDTDEEVEVTP